MVIGCEAFCGMLVFVVEVTSANRGSVDVTKVRDVYGMCLLVAYRQRCLNTYLGLYGQVPTNSLSEGIVTMLYEAGMIVLCRSLSTHIKATVSESASFQRLRSDYHT